VSDGVPVSLPATWPELRAALDADRRRNRSAGQRLTLLIFRVGQYCSASRSLAARVLRPLWLVLDRLYLRTLLGAELPATLHCGSGLALPHAGRGVVIHHTARLGVNCMVFHRATIGTHGIGRAPVIGDDVLVGTAACVIGPITVGEHAEIGANTVVSSDVPPWTRITPGPPREVRRTRRDGRA
jgi:serine O-acetyltransferase